MAGELPRWYAVYSYTVPSLFGGPAVSPSQPLRLAGPFATWERAVAVIETLRARAAEWRADPANIGLASLGNPDRAGALNEALGLPAGGELATAGWFVTCEHGPAESVGFALPRIHERAAGPFVDRLGAERARDRLAKQRRRFGIAKDQRLLIEWRATPEPFGLLNADLGFPLAGEWEPSQAGIATQRDKGR